MATILFAWELGAGLGHINLMRPLAEGLRQRGHDVRLALRDLSRASELFDPVAFPFYQTPCKLGPVPDVVRVPRTFAHILHNVGFARAGELLSLAWAWRRLFEHVRPDLVVIDHSPTALLALRGWPVRRAVMGTGFTCPFRVAKQEAGLMHYEGRDYTGLTRHLILSLIVVGFVSVHTERLRGKNPELSLEQVCRALNVRCAAILGRRRGVPQMQRTSDVIRYHQRRNAQAAKSHKKRRPKCVL